MFDEPIARNCRPIGDLTIDATPQGVLAWIAMILVFVFTLAVVAIAYASHPLARAVQVCRRPRPLLAPPRAPRTGALPVIDHGATRLNRLRTYPRGCSARAPARDRGVRWMDAATTASGAPAASHRVVAAPEAGAYESAAAEPRRGSAHAPNASRQLPVPPPLLATADGAMEACARASTAAPQMAVTCGAIVPACGAAELRGPVGPGPGLATGPARATGGLRRGPGGPCTACTGHPLLAGVPVRRALHSHLRRRDGMGRLPARTRRPSLHPTRDRIPTP